MTLLLSHFRKNWSRLQNRPSGKAKKDQNHDQEEQEQEISNSQLSTEPEHIDLPKIILPLELYQPIIEQVALTKDIYNILFVSQLFRLEAERVLYRSAIFQPSQYSRLPRFLEKITLFDRLALHVRDLHIEAVTRATLNILIPALQQMCNLQRLTLISDMHSTSISSFSFSGCRFQLHTLVLLGGITTNDDAFLETQKELTELDIRPSCNISLTSEALPKLLILSTSFPGSMYFFRHRPIRALCFQKCPPGFCGRKQSLRSLVTPYRGPPEGFSAMLEGFPSLRYLVIIFRREIVWASDFAQTFFSLLSHMNSLETLHFGTELSPEQRDETVENSFRFLKNLQMLILECDSEDEVAVWIPGAKQGKNHPRNFNEWKDCRWN